jgi:hypothetical protein
MALTFFTSDLLDLIIIEISSDNYQYKETSSREVEQTGCTNQPATVPSSPHHLLLEHARSLQIGREESDQHQI